MCPGPPRVHGLITPPPQYDVLMMYDWDHPDKLVPDKSIDFAKIKDSQLLHVFAKQLTLMEFAVYAAIQRRWVWSIG